MLLPAPGAAAGKVADKIGDVVGNFTRSVERGTVREALEGTQTAGKVIGEIAESSVPKQTGRLLSEGTSGPASGTSASKTVRSVEAEVIPPKMVDRPMFAAGGANSVTRRQYIMANLAESRAGNDVSGFAEHVKAEMGAAAARSMAAERISGRVTTLVERVDAPNPLTGAGYGVNNPPVRISEGPSCIMQVKCPDRVFTRCSLQTTLAMLPSTQTRGIKVLPEP